MIARHRQWINEMMLKWGREGYRKDPLLLFPGFGGEPLAPEKLTNRLRQFQRQAKVKGVMPTRGFRYGMASQLVACNVNIRQVADRTGHSTTWFTMQRYAHPVEGGDAAAAAALGGQLQTMMRKADLPS
jgi:integrase